MLSSPDSSGRRSSPPNSEVSFLPLRDHDDEADAHDSRRGDESRSHLDTRDATNQAESRPSFSSGNGDAPMPASDTFDDGDDDGDNALAGARPARACCTSQRMAIAVAGALAIVCALLLAGVLPQLVDDDDDGGGPTSAPGPSITTFIYLSEASRAESTFANMTDVTHLRVGGKGPAWRLLLGQVYALVINLADGFDVTLVNGLPESTIVHPHGLLPPVGEDGVPFLAAPPILPNATRQSRYAIVNRNSGTYFAHAHFALQHPRGIAFPIIVRGPDFPPDYPFAAQLAAARDVIMMIADFCPYATDLGNQSNPTCDGRNVAAYLDSKFKGNATNGKARDCVTTATATDVLFQRLLVNGRAADAPLVQPMPLNSVVRLRAINAGAMSHVVLRFPPFATVYIVSVDGVATQPQLVTGNFWLGTAQRADFFFELNNVDAAVGFPIMALTEASDVAVDGAGWGLQGVLLLHAVEQGLPAQRSWPLTYSATPAWPLPGFMAAATEVTLRAYQSLRNPMRKPERSYQVDLTGDNGFKSINGVSYRIFPERQYAPNPNPLRVRLGDRVWIRFTNYNADNHAMHLHGHAFQVIEIDGAPVLGAMRDTLIVPGGACHTVLIAFDADNPGVWLLHCHMEYHMLAGMITTVEYVA